MPRRNPVYRGEHVVLHEAAQLSEEARIHYAEAAPELVTQDPERAAHGYLGGSFAENYGTPQAAVLRFYGATVSDELDSYVVASHAGEFLGIGENLPEASFSVRVDEEGQFEHRTGICQVFVPQGAIDYVNVVADTLAGMRAQIAKADQVNTLEEPTMPTGLRAAYASAGFQAHHVSQVIAQEALGDPGEVLEDVIWHHDV